MAIPVWVLLAFVLWTVLTLLTGVGVYRWSQIITGRREIRSFRADRVEGPDFYQRAMRAHANCVENLPLYGAVVLAAVVAGADNPTLDVLALVLIGARVVHTIIHVGFVQTNLVAALRFTFFFPQLVCIVWMGVEVARVAAG